MSETGLIYKKISAVMADIGSIGKDRQNVEQKYKFRGIEDLYNAAHPAMIKHGVFCAPSVLEYETSERQKANGGVAYRVLMRVAHRFYAEDGSSVEVITTGEGIDSSDKAANKCLSAAFKYALMEIFCVPTQDIEDADRTTPEAGEGKPLAAAPVTFKRPSADAASPTPAPPEVESKSVVKRKAAMKAPEGQMLPPVQDSFIPTEKQQWFAMTFRTKLDIKYQQEPICEQLRKGWLKAEGFVGADGEGSASAILESQFPAVAKRAFDWAKAQGGAVVITDDDVPF